jgi:hypothetical protein
LDVIKVPPMPVEVSDHVPVVAFDPLIVIIAAALAGEATAVDLNTGH